MRLVGITFHRHIAVGLERPIDTTIVFISVLRVMVLRPDSCGFSLVLCRAALEALDAIPKWHKACQKQAHKDALHLE